MRWLALTFLIATALAPPAGAGSAKWLEDGETRTLCQSLDAGRETSGQRMVLAVDAVTGSAGTPLRLMLSGHGADRRFSLFPAIPFDTRAGDAPRRYFLPALPPGVGTACYAVTLEGEGMSAAVRLETTDALAE